MLHLGESARPLETAVRAVRGVSALTSGTGTLSSVITRGAFGARHGARAQAPADRDPGDECGVYKLWRKGYLEGIWRLRANTAVAILAQYSFRPAPLPAVRDFPTIRDIDAHD